MTVIAVKKEKDCIYLWSDLQTTYWYNKEKSQWKITKVNDSFYIWSAWFSKINNLVGLFCENYKLKDNTEREIIRFFNNFENRLDKETNKSTLKDNNFIIVSDWKIYNFNDFYLKEIDDFYAIWSWWDKALMWFELWMNIEKVLKAVCKYDLYCNEPIQIFKILRNNNE